MPDELKTMNRFKRWIDTKTLFAVALLVLAASIVFAETRTMVEGTTLNPLPRGSYVTEAVYYSSATCAATSATNIAISTTPALLHAVQITSAAVGPSTVDLFDAQNNLGTRRIAVFNGAVTGNYQFNVATASGIWLNSAGAIPPCVNVIYSQR